MTKLIVKNEYDSLVCKTTLSAATSASKIALKTNVPQKFVNEFKFKKSEPIWWIGVSHENYRYIIIATKSNLKDLLEKVK